MVLDHLITPNKAAGKPHAMLVLGALFVSFGILVEYFLPSMGGSALVFAVLPAVPLFWSLLAREEEKDECVRASSLVDAVKKEGALLSRHSRLVKIYAFFFLGAVLAFTAWYALLPADAGARVFAPQLEEVSAIQGLTTGWSFNVQRAWFLFSHNLGVLALMLAFCLLYGIGSVYLLVWNAAILGVVLGEAVKAGGVMGFVYGFLGLLPHGSLEIAGYFVASIAGGILSAGLTKSRHCPGGMRQVLVDTATLALASVALIALGALLEGSY
ncbi:MAG: stage II sporulation protein M [Candidatus Micrarchaeia archaeon]